MAYYPTGYRIFTTKRDFTETIFASHVNDLQAELAAAQTILGINPHIAPRDPGLRTVNHGTVAARIQTYLRGDHQLYFQGYVTGYPLTPGNTQVPPPPTPTPPQQPAGDHGCPDHERGQRWFLPVHSRSFTATGLTDLTGLTFEAPSASWQQSPDPEHLWMFRTGADWDDDDHYCGLPLVDDPATTEDGRWWRLPIAGTDDPYQMGATDGIVLPDTGLWFLSLRVDGLPTEQTTAASAVRRARLEINGQDSSLRHRIQENAYNGDALRNVIHWTEVLPRGTIITASARIDGPGLVTPVPVNAYLRAHMVRAVDSPAQGGELADAPAPVRTPAPPAPSTPGRVNTGSVIPTAPESGNYAYEMPPGSGHWVGQYKNGTTITGTAPNGQIPFFPGIAKVY